jgi:dUTP pyrophosphatase
MKYRLVNAVNVLKSINEPSNWQLVPIEEKMKIKVKKLRDSAVIPTYAHGPDEDAGFDLRAIESTILKPLVPTLVKTGLSIELPPGIEAQIRSRSGLALKQGIMVLNSPGTVDPSYRGEIGVILVWNGHSGLGPWATPGSGAEIILQEGDRIAQMVVAAYQPVVFEVVNELSDTARGEGGFGSTGV